MIERVLKKQEGRNWTHLALERGKRKADGNTPNNIRVVQTAGNFLTSRALCVSASEEGKTGRRAERKCVRTRSWLLETQDLDCFVPFYIVT
jgi:hypothetical protein